MDHKNYPKGLFESIPDYREKVLKIILIENDIDFLTECGFFKNKINRLCLECRNNLLEQKEEYLVYIENQEKSVLKRSLI